jgi:tRNA-Thr(GGU) m(6)t(6)A37 methyltransferase TsaA
LKAKELVLKPIGYVQADFGEEEIKKQHEATESTLIINPKLGSALDGIESYSHLIVIYYMHKVPSIKELKIHPRRRKDIRKVGLFATRTLNRPNLIGVTVVKLLERHYNIVKVQGLDAVDGTPILDIKPYIHSDIRENIGVPKWGKSYRRCFSQDDLQ